MHHCSLTLNVNEKNKIELGGCWPEGSKGWQNFSIQNPALFASNVLTHYLTEQGIVLRGHVETGYEPKGLKLIAKHESKPLHELLQHELKDSDNVYAESLLKTIGYYHTGHGTFQEGVNTEKAELTKLADIDFQQTTINDGSGQSRYDLLMPRQITKLLYSVYHNRKLKKDIMTALPISGVDGTLHYRMRSAMMKGKVHAKTGSMSGVSTLSGYMTAGDGKELIFSIMVNHFLGKIKKARAFQDEVCQDLYQI